ncbi:MAG TPA: hypothetical protein VG714_10915 [Acidobacteriaceae bacterium]|nr:hypothetical protein [Acidobacteriaceae bacterium]
MTILVTAIALACAVSVVASARAQGGQRPLTGAASQPDSQSASQQGTSSGAPRRTRLILKDGSYQVVMSYTVKGKVVSYFSAERGDTEEIPADLIDWDATRKWQRDHSPAQEYGADQAPAAHIDPELEKEEADRRALTPEIAPDLNLPDQDSVLALDYYRGTPELVPLVQSDGELNRETSHNVLKLTLNPRAASHAIVELKGVESAVQMHVAQPVIYLRVGDDSGVSRGGGVFTVDTHGAGSAKGGADTNDTSSGGSQYSGYVMVRADVRTDARVLASFNIGALGSVGRPQQDVVETKTEMLPGGHWMKITPVRPLDFGEYALMEIVSDNAVNTGVWDFGVHPVAPENRDVIKPEPKRPIELERRRP